MSVCLGVLLFQSVAQLLNHGLVVRPLPVVDDEPAGAAGEQLLTESELTTTTVSGDRERFASPDFQSRPPIIHYKIILLVQCGREAEVGLELSLSPITRRMGKVIGDCVDAHLSGGHIVDKLVKSSRSSSLQAVIGLF